MNTTTLTNQASKQQFERAKLETIRVILRVLDVVKSGACNMETSESVQNPENGKDSSEDLEETISVSPVTEIKQEVDSDRNDDNDNTMEIDESSTVEEDTKSVDSEIVIKKENIEIATSPQSRKRKLDDFDDDVEEEEELCETENSSPIDFLGFPDGHSDEGNDNRCANNSKFFLNFIRNHLKRHEEKKEKFEKPSVKSDNLVFDTALGKGKRSRIPNKKYETPTIRSFSKKSTDNIDFEGGPEVTSSEDGRNEDESEVHKMDDASSEVSSSAHSSPSVGNRAKNSRLASSVASPHNKKPKFTVDMTNPNFLKPFDHGWRRELVYRSSCDSYGRRNGDVYYYMPTGQKIRSMRELIETLDAPDLTPEDFTFFKEPVGLNDLSKEIVRNAKVKGTWGGTPILKKVTPKSKTGRERTVSSTPEIGKSPRLGGFKVKIPGSSRLSQGAQKTDRKRSVDSDMEMGMLPPVWSPKKGSASKQSPWQAKHQREPSPPKTRRSVTRKTTLIAVATPKLDAETRFMQNYLQNLSYGYQTLMYVFQYLKVQDLLRAGCVCTLWRDIAAHPSLWRTVRMKNSQVSNWEGLADALKKHRTENLDLRKMLLPNSGDDMWPLFSKAIVRVDSLIRIELCRCPASVIEELAKSNSNLQVINAVTIRCETLDVASMSNVANLQELRLKSTNGFALTSDLSPLKQLTKLKHLSLTSVKELNKQNVEIIGNLINLESLDLGECSDFPDHFGTDVIGKLTKLEKLRLEKGQGTCCTFDILDAVSKISTLEQLELVNFDVKAGFDKALGACVNIKKLLIIPTYISQSATTNHMVLGGVIKLKATLSHFVWGVTLELLRVTELFVDQCEDSPNKDKKKSAGNGDSIPVLKPVPIMKVEETNEVSSKEPPQVEILPLPTLQKLLLNALPTTRVKILKIPFHATWRQSIVDTVN